MLGYPADCREYNNAAHILKQLGFTSVRLMTNNHEGRAYRQWESMCARVPLEMPPSCNARYLNET